MSATAEAWVDERGVLRVPLTPHTCHEWSKKPCPACDEMQAYWESFEAPANVTPLEPMPMDWDTAHDLNQMADDADPPEVLL
jgi:hypothetical protein